MPPATPSPFLILALKPCKDNSVIYNFRPVDPLVKEFIM